MSAVQSILKQTRNLKIWKPRIYWKYFYFKLHVYFASRCMLHLFVSYFKTIYLMIYQRGNKMPVYLINCHCWLQTTLIEKYHILMKVSVPSIFSQLDMTPWFSVQKYSTSDKSTLPSLWAFLTSSADIKLPWYWFLQFAAASVHDIDGCIIAFVENMTGKNNLNSKFNS